ncbi:hypothetical protein [Sphaerisporangium siamense]|uniref:Uncharacterized protein n=1 Tax=Sphaerisporangium siamense TaxID=795645 RepID=A0A7W7DE55_9ACTN|nr:hypothetical protein [Sphaerisporangium siamense]MBB4705210.1 hypothetical protein [Sphaerisporangium siamense]
MNPKDDRVDPRDNPFPSVPIARLTGSSDLLPVGLQGGRVPITVETGAIAAMRAQLDAWRRQRLNVPSVGRALAVVGDLGTGKSHIARDLAHTVMTRPGPAAPVLWLIDEPVWDFGQIYRERLVTDLKDQKSVFYEVLLDYYSDVTAESLAGSRSLDSIAAGLKGRDLDPQAVIDALNLSEAAIRADLERRLQGLTEHGKFASALALLQIPGFQNAVWEWFMGHPPSDILRERGIDSPIDDVSSVFEALAVFAFLYGRAGRRFILVVDMLEKVLEWPIDRRTAFVQAFEKLVNVYVSVGGLLVFCVVPDALGMLGEGVQERIRPIRTTALTDEETVELTRRYLERARGTRGAALDAPGPEPDVPAAPPPVPGAPEEAPADLAPFTVGSLRYIRSLAGGVPRRVLKICHHAWAQAARRSPGDGPSVVDEVIVRDAVRATFETATLEQVRASIRSVLELESRRFEPSPVRFSARPAGEAGKVDFWIPVGRQGAAIAVLTTDSVMQSSQVERLERIVWAARKDTGAAPCQPLVVVNGYLSPALRQRIAELTDAQPVVYSDRDFTLTLREAVRELARRLEAADRDGVLDVIRSRVEDISYQQTTVLDYLQRIDGRVEQADAASARRLGELLRSLPAEPEPRERRREHAHPRAARHRMPEDVERHFDRAFDAIGLMSGVPATFRDVFTVDETAAADVRPRRLGFTMDEFQAVGVAVLLEKLLEAFRDSVAAWLEQADAARSLPGETVPTTAQERRLRTICRSYEITAEMLPVFRLESMAAFGPFTEGPEPIEHASRTFRRAEAEDALSRLGERVLAAAMASVRT